MADRLRVGIAGYGVVGQRRRHYIDLHPNLETVAVCDRNMEGEGRFEDGVRYTTHYERLIDEPLDVLYVCLTNDINPEATIAGLDKGLHVFCEKPLSATIADANAMIAATDEADVALMVGHVLRFYPLHKLGRKMVDDGLIGDIVYLETDYCGKYSGPRTKPDTWFGKMGGLLENGIHKADLINWFGGEAETVAAEAGSFSGEPYWEDYTMSLIRYKLQAVGVLRWGSFMGARGSRGTIIDGTKGSMKLDMDSGNVYHMLMGESEWTETIPSNKGADGVVGELQHFVDCVRDGKKPTSNGRDGRNAVEVVLATYKSARDGIKITLPME